MASRKNRSDAVALMRGIRDRLSQEYAGLTFTQQRLLMDAQLQKHRSVSSSRPATLAPSEPPNRRLQPSKARRRPATKRSSRARLRS